ncbi:MAG TPA: CRTAC1 family protein, partial [Candidatus Polarisedimenticolia bacterium]|nr:CRTAC1 family protein [Candidatus Polarisedimenticolia bacterium]
RWLLNIAYMTLGEYPAGVPAEWLIEPAVFASEGEIKRFTDIAGSLGLDVDDLAGGSIVDDFDNDGFLDVMVSSSRLTGQLRYFKSQGDGTFQERTEPAGLTGEIGGLNLVSTDYNNDGFIDAFVLRGGWLESAGRIPNSLLRNNGDGTFEDVTEEAGLLSFHPTQTADWFDYDGDGLLDLYIGNESRGEEVHPCELYHNNGDGTFTDVAQQSGVANVGYVKAVSSGDYDNDGRPDLYLSRKGLPNVLYHNDGPTGQDADGRPVYKFTDVAAAAKVTEPIQSFPTWFFDYDNDGWEDLFVAGYAIRNVGDVAADYLGLQHPGERCRLFHNEHNGTFSDVTRESGLYRVLLAMGSNFGDIDNDGWLDFYVGTGDPYLTTLVPNRMFRNDGGKRFLDVTTSGGVGHLQKGHGVSFADIDNDGDQDIYEDMGGAFWGDQYRSVLYQNEGYGNHWITLQLYGTASNRSAIGARIAVVVVTRDGERTIYRTVGTGGSFGVNPSRQEIGLGGALSVKSVEIAWPAGGAKQVLRGLAMDRFYAIREGAAEALQLKRKILRFAVDQTHPASHHHE